MGSIKNRMNEKTERMKKVRELLNACDTYVRYKSVYDGLNKIKFKKAREHYKDENEVDLRLFYMARRKLREEFGKDRVSARKLSDEYDTLEKEYNKDYAEFRAEREELNNLLKIRREAESAMRRHDREQTRNDERKNRNNNDVSR